MLTEYAKHSQPTDVVDNSNDSNATHAQNETLMRSAKNRGLLSRMLKVEWLGQTAASLFWIASVFTYGISSTGDWLQLCAASAWLAANIATLVATDID